MAHARRSAAACDRPSRRLRLSAGAHARVLRARDRDGRRLHRARSGRDQRRTPDRASRAVARRHDRRAGRGRTFASRRSTQDARRQVRRRILRERLYARGDQTTARGAGESRALEGIRRQVRSSDVRGDSGSGRTRSRRSASVESASIRKPSIRRFILRSACRWKSACWRRCGVASSTVPMRRCSSSRSKARICSICAPGPGCRWCNCLMTARSSMTTRRRGRTREHSAIRRSARRRAAAIARGRRKVCKRDRPVEETDPARRRRADTAAERR